MLIAKLESVMEIPSLMELKVQKRKVKILPSMAMPFFGSTAGRDQAGVPVLSALR
jgi:hypothetical protein